MRTVFEKIGKLGNHEVKSHQRFGMMHMTRCLGVILLNPTTNKVTMMDNLKDRFQKWKISHVNDLTGEQMVAFRKFGHKVIFYFL